MKNNKKITKTLSLKKYIDNISEKYLDELYDKAEFKEKNLSKKENVILSINAEVIKTILSLTREDIEQIKQVDSGNVPEKINDALIDKYILYDKYGNKEYFISKDIKEMINDINIEEIDITKKLTYTMFYIEANGILKIDRLIKLIKDTGINITKKEIRSILKDLNYYVKDDIVYEKEVLYRSNFGIKLLKEKEKIPYVTYSELEIMLLASIIMSNEHTKKISNIIHKKVKDELKAEIIIDLIITTIHMFINYEDEVLSILERDNIILSNKDMEILFNTLEEMSKIYPKWSLNGKILEDFDEENYFEELPEEDKIEIYISQYIDLNGVLTIEKMLEILEYHHLNITKKELIKIVKKIEGIVISKEYICFDNIENDIEYVLMNKNTKKYKLINNIDDIIDELQYNIQTITDICLKYGISEKKSEGIIAYITYGVFNEISFNDILMENNIFLPKNILDNLYKELSKASKDIRTWKYNGYTENEINLLSKKQGRNELCACGSGKKYKNCCGK